MATIQVERTVQSRGDGGRPPQTPSMDMRLWDPPVDNTNLLVAFARAFRASYVKTQLRFSPVGFEVKALADHLRDDPPAADPGGTTLTLLVGSRAIEGPDRKPLGAGMPHVAGFLRRMGIRSLICDRELKSYQISDVLAEIWGMRRGFARLVDRPGRRGPAIDALLSHEGLNIACTQVRFLPATGELSLQDSYCQAPLSRAARSIKKRGQFEADHRQFFYSAPKFAVLALVVGMAPVVMLLAGVSHRPVALAAAVLSVVSAFLVYLFLLTLGELEYDNEIAKKRLERTLSQLRRRDEETEVDLRRARKVQESLLPGSRLTEFREHVDVAYELLPQRHVGGDFLDLRWVGDDRVAVIIADVAGHGLPAALIGATLATSFWYQLPVERTLTEKVLRINKDLYDLVLSDSFVTLIYGEVDLTSRVMRYCCAGHPPALIVDRNGRIRECTQVSGPPVGSIPDPEYRQFELGLQPGDTLVLYTDGITEAHNPRGEIFGDGRLREAITALPPTPSAKDVVASLQRAILEFEQGQAQSDDQALLAVRLNHV